MRQPEPAAEPEAETAPTEQSQDLARQRDRRRRRRRRRRLISLLIVAVVIGGAGYAAYQVWFAPEATAEVRYLTATVQVGDIEESVSSVGTLSPSQSRDVQSVVQGSVESMLVAVGDVVAVGDQLAQIDTSSFEATAMTADAQLTSLRASLADAEAQLELQRQNLARQEGLFEADAVSESTVQSASAQVIAAEAQVESVRAQIVQQEQTLGTAQEDIEDSTIVAEIPGTIVSVEVEEGQYVEAGTLMLSIAELSTMTVEAQVSEADVGQLYIGMRAYFSTLASSDRQWEGTLSRIDPTPDVENDVVLYNVEFEVENPDGTLMIGMSTETFFVVVGAEDVLTVPVAALQQAGLANGAGGAAPTGAAATNGGGAAGEGGFPGGGQPPAGFDPSQLPAGVQGGQPPAGFDPSQLPQGAGAPQGGTAPAGANQAAGADTGGSTTYTVRILEDDGTTITNREVEIGVQDRVNAEVISGLSAGEQVVTSVLQGAAPAGDDDDDAADAAAGGAPGGFGGGGPPGGGFGGGGPPGF